MSASKRLRREKSNAEIKVARTSDTQLLQQIDAKFTSQRKVINMELLQLIDDKFAEQRESLGREYRESDARFLNTLQAKFNLTKRVRELETEAKEVNTLKQQVCELDAQLSAKCNAQEVADAACNLRWHGVPQVEGENLNTLFNRLCFPLHLHSLHFRVRPRQRNSLVDPVIIIKMDHVREKAALLRAIGVHRQTTKSQLSLQLIGFDSQAFIYLNEQLTKTNYEIFKHAMRLKKQKRVAAVFTRRGDVFIKPIDGEEAYYVQSSNELSDLGSDVSEINSSRNAALANNSFRN